MKPFFFFFFLMNNYTTAYVFFLYLFISLLIHIQRTKLLTSLAGLWPKCISNTFMTNMQIYSARKFLS